MLVRIVRMEFQREKLQEFLVFFEKSKPKILSFEGCEHVELFRDESDPTVQYTLSHWQSSKALDAYRNSGFFRETWSYTKSLFRDKAKAFSLVKN